MKAPPGRRPFQEQRARARCHADEETQERLDISSTGTCDRNLSRGVIVLEVTVGHLPRRAVLSEIFSL
eukprot:7956739-Lingulodinium_polyedra.AAC.1